jgi:tetratricopeptide (TPR) repeat protein
MSTAIATIPASQTAAAVPLVPATHLQQIPVVPWRDPQTVSPEELSVYICSLEQACLAQPESADVRTLLGMAYAMNYDAYKSMDILEAAIAIDSNHFWAQLKYGELHYRLRALVRAEEETLKALDLARNPWELSVARRQLQEIRKLLRDSTRAIVWRGSLMRPAVVLSLGMAALFAVMFWG